MSLSLIDRPVSVERLLQAYHSNGPIPLGVPMDFQGRPGTSVYNITGRLEDLHLGREEDLSSDPGSEYRFWSRGFSSVTDPITGHESFRPDRSIRRRKIQDPTIAQIMLSGVPHVILSGVAARPAPPDIGGGPQSDYWMRTWAGPSIRDLVELRPGENERKGNRFLGMADNLTGIFTRPQGKTGGRGQLGFTTIPARSVPELKRLLTPSLINGARLLPRLVPKHQWVGPNQAFLLEEGRIGLILHVAHFLDDERRPGKPYRNKAYYAASLIFEPSTNRVYDLQIIATRYSFLTIGNKPGRPDLWWVLYPCGAEILPNGQMKLYVGIGDVAAGYVIIDDPFAGLHASGALFPPQQLNPSWAA